MCRSRARMACGMPTPESAVLRVEWAYRLWVSSACDGHGGGRHEAPYEPGGLTGRQAAHHRRDPAPPVQLPAGKASTPRIRLIQRRGFAIRDVDSPASMVHLCPGGITINLPRTA